MTATLAIDVGKRGGFALQTGGTTLLYKMPETEGDILTLLEGCRDALVYVELVPTGMPNRGAAMVKLNVNAAFIRGAVMALKMRMILVRPAEWQAFFNLGKRSGCKSDNEWKNKLKAEAQRRYPGLAITHHTADALLILEWARAQVNTPLAEKPTA